MQRTVGKHDAMDPDAVEAIYAWLDERHPDAPVTAVGSDGLSVPLPDDFPVGDHVVLKGRSALDFVQPADHVAVVAAWERTRADGATRVTVRLVSGHESTVHVVDLRHRYGCYIAVFAPAEEGAGEAGADLLAGHDDRSGVPTRVCRMRRDEVAVVVDFDEAATALLGWDEDLLGQRSIELVHPDDVERAIANWMEMLAGPGRPHRWRGRYRRADGSWLWLDITNVNRLEDPVHGDVLTEMIDISDEMAMHEVLRERERLLRRLTDALPSGVIQFDVARRTLHGNDQFGAIVGEATLDALAASVADAEHRRRLDAAVAALFAAGADADLEVHLLGDRVCRVALRALVDDGGAVTGGIACVDDVTDGVRMRRQLELRATFDALTACFSRSAILAALDDVSTRQPGTGVVFVDLDRFKPVNDRYGHAAGDELLATIGERIRGAVRDVDMVGRLGGDEFLVVCPGVADATTVDAIAARVAEAIAEPVVLGGTHLIAPCASIGTAWAASGADATALVAEADAAMYAVKES